MKKNMGTIDRTLRIIVGALLLYFGLIDTALVENQVVQYIMVFFGGMNIFTSIIAFCPMYTLANLSTIRKSDNT